MSFNALLLSPEEKEALRTKLLKKSEIVPLVTDPKYFAEVIALGIQQEIGTIHDEFSTFLFCGHTGVKVSRESLKAELIEYRGYTGVRIWAEGFGAVDPRVRGIRTLLYPELSYNKAGEIYQCVFFPEIIWQIAALEGAELVSVKPWGINTVFGGFDATKSYYEGNMFEFVNIDAIRYAQLLEKRQIVFWGTHDLVSHVAGLRKSAWPELEARGRAARLLFEEYFVGIQNPAPYALVLPYVLGMLLDDMAQPMNYNSESRRFVIDLLMDAIRSKVIHPERGAYLMKFPDNFERLINLARADKVVETRSRAPGLLTDLIQELNAHAVFKKAG